MTERHHLPDSLSGAAARAAVAHATAVLERGVHAVVEGFERHDAVPLVRALRPPEPRHEAAGTVTRLFQRCPMHAAPAGVPPPRTSAEIVSLDPARKPPAAASA